MQGTVTFESTSVFVDRFIPAYAGNGSQGCFKSVTYTVHPRVCRERTTFSYPSRCRSGSSPRMQGTVLTRHASKLRTRFIPAYAGNGTTTKSKSNSGSVHPRVCRERYSVVAAGQPGAGSSPRMQGTGI